MVTAQSELGDELVGVEDGDLAVLAEHGHVAGGVAASDAEQVLVDSDAAAGADGGGLDGYGPGLGWGPWPSRGPSWYPVLPPPPVEDPDRLALRVLEPGTYLQTSSDGASWSAEEE